MKSQTDTELMASALYVGYELLSFLVHFYGTAARTDYGVARKQHWDHNCERALSDLERLYDIWQAMSEEVRYGLPVHESAALRMHALHLRRRFAQIQNALGSWEILRRLPPLFTRCERGLASLLTCFAEDYPYDRHDFQALEASARHRMSALAILVQQFHDESAVLGRREVPLA